MVMKIELKDEYFLLDSSKYSISLHPLIFTQIDGIQRLLHLKLMPHTIIHTTTNILVRFCAYLVLKIEGYHSIHIQSMLTTKNTSTI